MSNREKLEKQIQEIEVIRPKADSAEFNAWESKTKRILESIFGVGSSVVVDFQSISYSWVGVACVGDVIPKQAFQEAYERGLDMAKLLLQGMLDEVGEDPIPSIKKDKDRTYIEINIREMFDNELIKVSRGLFEDEHYSQSVLESMKLVENKVKDIVLKKTGTEIYGTDLMNRAFSIDHPIIKLTNLQTISDKDIQRGYMEIFRGSISAIKNPKSHDLVQLEKEKAIHFLFLANLLLMRLKEAGFKS